MSTATATHEAGEALAHELPTDEMLTDEDKSFVRSTAIGVGIGVIGMFAFIAVAASLVARDAGWQFWIGSATFASMVTGGFFGGVVFAARHLMVQEKQEALQLANARAQYVRAA